jgi:hypothetical protein
MQPENVEVGPDHRARCFDLQPGLRIAPAVVETQQ